MLPVAKGTYALILRAAAPFQVQIGKAGLLIGETGFYIYIGSAFGAGGLRARVGRHLRTNKRLHWHIDYLRQQLAVENVWFSAAATRYEHQWAAQLATHPTISIPLPHFGASDCTCPAHLFFSPAKPKSQLLISTTQQFSQL